jgi:all-trans-retinol 13,14-reductase
MNPDNVLCPLRASTRNSCSDLREKYDHLVVGSGISGLTAALLLGLNGRSVLLIEKAPAIGGSLSRFRLNGIPFDTGFHFTGGFSPGGLLDDMLRVLGLRDAIRPEFLPPERANRFIFEQTGESIDFAGGQALLIDRLSKQFPDECDAVQRYFERVNRVREKTSTMDLRNIHSAPEPIDEDFITLQSALDELTGNSQLKAVLSGFAMCYGTPPGEISFAAHCRMCHGLYESVARVEQGGDAFIRAFKQAFEPLKIDIACGTEITECLDLHDRIVGKVRLSSGHIVSFGTGLFTINPHDILRVLPEEQLSRGFIHRVDAFEASAGFFTLFAVVQDGHVDSQIVSLFPGTDVNAMLDADSDDESAIVIMRSRETVNGKPCGTLTAFEPCFEKKTAQWAGSELRNRPAEYYDWKEKKTARMCERIFTAFPELREKTTVLDSASPLTFRDYLHSPDGSAYGIKQKTEQFNLIGRLPWRNLFAAGQSALLPGIVGAMMSSFIVVRSLLGRQDLNTFIHERLGE